MSIHYRVELSAFTVVAWNYQWNTKKILLTSLNLSISLCYRQWILWVVLVAYHLIWSKYPVAYDSTAELVVNNWGCAGVVCEVAESSFGRTNGAPLRWRWQDGGSSASGRHLGWPHFRFPWGHFLGSGHPRWRPEAELPPSCHLHLNGAPFVLPMSWMTSVGRLHRSLNVLQTSASHETSRADHRESKFFQRHSEIPYDDVWLFFWLLGSIWSLASPSHSWNDWGSCPLATTRKSISLHMSTPRLMENSYPWGMVLALASTYFFFFFFFNCTLQYSRFIEEYSVIVGRNLVWLETNFTPTMTILGFPRFYRPSHNDRTVRVWGQFGSVRLVRCLGCRSQSIVIHDFYSRHVQP